MQREPFESDSDAFEGANEELEELAPGPEVPPTEEIIQQIKETAEKLLRDHTNRADVKMLNTALKELRYAFKMTSAFQHRRKVSVFGSARLPLDHPACQQAIQFSRRISQAGFMVITGAANGIMEAGHVGAGRDQSIGFNILLPFEQQSNPIIAGDKKLVHLKYFFTRKLLFIKESDAVALFPGGFGTLDEGFEALTLVQTGKSHMFPIVMVDEPGGNYWKRWEEYVQEVLLDRKMISPPDLALFKVTDSVDEALEEVLGFYRVYHSMRYVGKDLVVRIRREIGPELLARLNLEFKDIIKSGKIVQTSALPEERNDAHIAVLPRLRFHFDRHGHGRLRMMIDLINQEG